MERSILLVPKTLMFILSETVLCLDIGLNIVSLRPSSPYYSVLWQRYGHCYKVPWANFTFMLKWTY